MASTAPWISIARSKLPRVLLKTQLITIAGNVTAGTATEVEPGPQPAAKHTASAAASELHGTARADAARSVPLGRAGRNSRQWLRPVFADTLVRRAGCATSSIASGRPSGRAQTATRG